MIRGRRSQHVSTIPRPRSLAGCRQASRGARDLLAALLACLACTVTPQTPDTAEGRSQALLDNAPLLLPHEPLDPASVSVEPEERTVESSWVLHLYSWFHSKRYTSSRLVFPGTERDEVVAHLLLPDGPGPYPVVMVFPILAGSHVVSEGLAKALISHGYAVARLERPPVDLEDPAVGPQEFSKALRGAVSDGRRLIDFLTTHPRVDERRLASAGVSLGGIQALLLAQTDPRVRGGFYVMVGGGLAQLLWDSTEKPVRAFRERLRTEEGLETRETFVQTLQEATREVDPLTYARLLEPGQVLLASGRFDRVMPPARTEELWQALGRPRWIHLPVGHYQLAPFFWWTAARGADHLNVLLGRSSSNSRAHVPKTGARGDRDE